MKAIHRVMRAYLIARFPYVTAASAFTGAATSGTEG